MLHLSLEYYAFQSKKPIKEFFYGEQTKIKSLTSGVMEIM